MRIISTSYGQVKTLDKRLADTKAREPIAQGKGEEESHLSNQV
jgi:hypothetical protein